MVTPPMPASNSSFGYSRIRLRSYSYASVPLELARSSSGHLD